MKMQAAVLEAVGTPLRLQELDIAAPVGSEVLVQVKASGLCHSDMFAAQHASGWPMPVLLGHEVAGVVVETGPLVRDLTPGDRVAACEVGHCGRCNDCVRGRIWRCHRPRQAVRAEGAPPRLSRDGDAVVQFSEIGGFAEYVLLDESNLVTIPDGLPFELAASLGCGVVTGAGAAINTAGVRVGDSVAVIGCGGVGLSAIWGSALAGARTVIAIDVVPGKLELARTFGATHCINALEHDAVERLLELTDGVGVDYAFEAAGLKATALQAIDMARKTGTALLIGIQDPESVLELRPFADLLIAQKSLQSVFMGSTNFKHDIPLYAEMYLQGRFPLEKLVSKTIQLQEINEGLAQMESGELARIVVTFP